MDDGPVLVVDLARGEKIPDDILQALSDENITKWAFNAMFERICLSAYLRRNYPQYFRSYSTNEDTVGDYLSPQGWKCSMTWAAYMGLPLSLKSVGEVLKLTEQKMDEGKALIRYFSIPCAPTASNGGRTRNLPKHDIMKWRVFKEYNKRDVEVEIGIQKRLHNFPVPDFIWEQYWLDQEINDRGIKVDMAVVRNAIKIDETTRNNLMDEMQDITALDNPNSVQQMKEWLARHGMEVDSLGKKEVQELLKTAPSGLAKVLMLRQQLAKSSVR
jgi:DNA polymerase